MMNLESILLGLLVVDAIALVVLILLQQGKGADVGASFGSGGSNTVFGGAGSASFLARLTTWLAIGFFALSFGLAYAAKERATSLSDVGLPQVTAPLQSTPAEDGADAALSDDTDALPSLEDDAVDGLDSATDAATDDVPDV